VVGETGKGTPLDQPFREALALAAEMSGAWSGMLSARQSSGARLIPSHDITDAPRELQPPWSIDRTTKSDEQTGLFADAQHFCFGQVVRIA
jgi:hypothetical protein